MVSSSSAPDPSTAPVIRAGSDGRLRFDPAHREALLDAFERGGTSAMAFARDHGVKYPTFIVSAPSSARAFGTEGIGSMYTRTCFL